MTRGLLASAMIVPKPVGVKSAELPLRPRECARRTFPAGSTRRRFPSAKLPLAFFVLADVGRESSCEFAAIEQDAEPEIVDTGVVADDREVLVRAEWIAAMKIFGNATQSKSDPHDGGAIRNERRPLVRGSHHLLHCSDYTNSERRTQNAGRRGSSPALSSADLQVRGCLIR